MTTSEIQALIDRAIPEDGAPTVRAPVIRRLLGVSATTLTAMTNDGRLPPVTKLSRRLQLFGRDEIRAALRRLLSEGGAA